MHFVKFYINLVFVLSELRILADYSGFAEVFLVYLGCIQRNGCSVNSVILSENTCEILHIYSFRLWYNVIMDYICIIGE